jgi:hypothetical protein
MGNRSAKQPGSASDGRISPVDAVTRALSVLGLVIVVYGFHSPLRPMQLNSIVSRLTTLTKSSFISETTVF